MILHFPFRGYRHYATKIEQGGRSYSANAELHQAMVGVWQSDYLSGLQDVSSHSAVNVCLQLRC